jgi:hypothetical protein
MESRDGTRRIAFLDLSLFREDDEAVPGRDGEGVGVSGRLSSVVAMPRKAAAFWGMSEQSSLGFRRDGGRVGLATGTGGFG